MIHITSPGMQSLFLDNMKKLIPAIILSALLGAWSGCSSQRSPEKNIVSEFSQTVDSIIESHSGHTGVALIAHDTIFVAGDSLRLPLMSIFKLHIAMTVLDKGISPDSVVNLKAADIRPNTYSPLRDSTGIRDIDITVDRLMHYSVCRSDNNACDALIDLVGGIGEVDTYIRTLDTGDFALSETEHSMHTDLAACYNNWTSASALGRVMEALYAGRALSPEKTAYLKRLLGVSSTGREKIASGIPAHALLGHKSGLSDRTGGLRMASGDVAAIQLPDSTTAFLAIIVMDSDESDEEIARIFTEISSAAYETYR